MDVHLYTNNYSSQHRKPCLKYWFKGFSLLVNLCGLKRESSSTYKEMTKYVFTIEIYIFVVYVIDVDVIKILFVQES